MKKGFTRRTTFAEQARRRLLLAVCWLGSAVVLLGTITVYLILAQTEPEPAVAAAAPEQAVEKVPVLLAARRIEAGSRLEPSMFISESFDRSRVPINVLPATGLDLAIGKYAARLIDAGYPLARDDFTSRAPLDKLPIPPGFRAVSIHGTQRELVDGYVTPNSRVDVLFHYTDQRGRQRVKTLVPFVKVLSVDGTNRDAQRSQVSKAGATATLLVTIRDAQRIELARRMGELTLALRGQMDGSHEQQTEFEIDECDITGGCRAPKAVRSGVLERPDPRTGKIVTYVLEDGEWRRLTEEEQP